MFFSLGFIFWRGTPSADDLRGWAPPVATDPRQDRDERPRERTWSSRRPVSAAVVGATRTWRRSARGRARTGAGRPSRGGRRRREVSCVRRVRLLVVSQRSAFGGQSAACGERRSAFGRRSAACGGRPSAGGRRPAACGGRPSAGGRRPATISLRQAAGGRRRSAFGRRQAAGGD